MDTGNFAFLGYSSAQTRLINSLREMGHRVTEWDQPVTDLSAYDHVVSFGYRHILRPSVLATSRRPIMNLHISYLPFNRGAHPNFWAWVESTPHGVSLHEIDAGLDTGPILAQRKVTFHSDLITLRQSQAQLIDEIERLFLETLPNWLDGTLLAIPQTGTGSYHALSDLPEWVTSWDISAREAKERYEKRR